MKTQPMKTQSVLNRLPRQAPFVLLLALAVATTSLANTEKTTLRV